MAFETQYWAEMRRNVKFDLAAERMDTQGEGAMPDARVLAFESYRLDLGREQLRCGEDVIPLTNKAFAVLRYLVEHADELVTRDTLLEAIWPETFVSEAALTVCIHELRQAFGETARSPQFIETVRGRGYRFLVPVTMPASALTRPEVLPAFSPQPSASPTQPVMLVGREAELRQLHQAMLTGLQGKRQLVFITGEAGIGKTALVDAFVTQVATTDAVWMGHGQCIEQYGAGEAYLPVLEALGRLGRSPEGHRLIEVLRQQAPSWLLQMPALLSSDEFDALQRRGSGVTRERMLRELAEALDTLTVEQPLVLVLEDLHWSDMSTLEWLAYVARRRDPARLLILATYRPVESIVRAHPLRTVAQELLSHGRCEEMLLDYLPEAGVATYLGQRFGDQALPERLTQVVYQRTNGNPLFMVTVVDEMIRRHVLVEGREGWRLQEAFEVVAAEVPETLRQLIEQQIEQLRPEDQVLLEAASIAGTEFSAATVAAGINDSAEVVEARCAALARRGQFLQASGTAEWPDGTVAARFGFSHALYQEVLYDRVSAGRQVKLHQQIGARQEAGYGIRAREMAAELATHFVRGRDYGRAVPYLGYAGENALRRSADQEAIAHLTQGLALLPTLPETPDRLHQELELQVALGPALMATKGHAAPDVERVYARARELCQLIGDTPQLFPVLRGLLVYYQMRGQLQAMSELGEQLLRLAQSQSEPALLMLAHHQVGMVMLYRGEPARAHTHHQQALAIYMPQQHRVLAERYGVDLGVASRSFLSWELWYLGYPDQALQHSRAACTLAQDVSHLHSLALALLIAAILHQLRREATVSQAQAAATMTLSTEQGFATWLARGRVLHGWALAMQGEGEAGIADIRQGLAADLGAGARSFQPYSLGLLAEAMGAGGSPEAGLDALTEALAVMDDTEVRFFGAELHRIKGSLLLQQAIPDEALAEVCFHNAIDVARQQQAKSWELRAVVSLSLLWQRQEKRGEARQLLAEIYDWFTEGFDTADLGRPKQPIGLAHFWTSVSEPKTHWALM